MKCNTCRHFDGFTKKCDYFDQIMGDITIVTCNNYERTSVKQGDIFWGTDTTGTIRYWFCHICHCWFEEKENHNCEEVLNRQESFIAPDEMRL